jgi:hypothetical protein
MARKIERQLLECARPLALSAADTDAFRTLGH